MKKEKWTVICDQSVDVHFPKHFSEVYRDLLPLEGIDADIYAFVRNRDKLWGQHDVSEINVIDKRANENVILNIVARVSNSLQIFLLMIKKGSIAESKGILVHNDPVLAAVSYFLARLTRKKFVYRITHLMSEEAAERTSGISAKLYTMSGRIRNWLCRHADLVFLNSKEMQPYIYGPEKKGGNWVELKSSVSVSEKSEGLEKCDQFAESIQKFKARTNPDCVAIYAGTISSARNLEVLLDIGLKLQQDGFCLVLVILAVVNKEREFNELAGELKSRDLEAKILLLRAVPEDCLESVVQTADIGLCPIPTSGIMKTNTPLKTLHYLTAGIPVVGSPIPDHEDVLKCSGGGVVSKSNRSRDLKEAIKVVCEAMQTDDGGVIRGQDLREWVKENRSTLAAASSVATALKGIS